MGWEGGQILTEYRQPGGDGMRMGTI